MAEFAVQRSEDIIPVLEQMERLKLFTKHEIRGIAKKHKEFEYKLQKQTKSKEDYGRYIQYEMDLLKLVKQRREKYQLGQKKADIDFKIIGKINSLYKDAISKFQDDIRFWMAYLKFCKHVKFNTGTSSIIARMLQVHQNKPKCWHVASKWELEENKSIETARQILLKGLHFHPDSQLLYLDLMKLELDEVFNKISDADDKPNFSKTFIKDEVPSELKRSFVVYQQAFKHVKDIKFILKVLDLVQEYSGSNVLQNKIISDMVKEYIHVPLMWDTMARRELEGLYQPVLEDGETVDIDSIKTKSLRDRIINCFEVYQAAVKRLKTEEIWDYFINCMIEINKNTDSLPNLRKKLLKSALLQGHKAKKLSEKFYLYWIDMLSTGEVSEGSNCKLTSIICSATETLPCSKELWLARMHHFISTDIEDLVLETFSKGTEVLGDDSIPLWKSMLLYTQAKHPEEMENFFNKALESTSAVRNWAKPLYIEWILLSKDITVARQVYEKLCLVPPLSIELHKKMCDLELLQSEISMQHIRRCYEMAIMQFGRQSIDVWMEFISFEMKQGEPTRVSQIYDRAVKMLEANLINTFTTQFSLIKTKVK